MDIHQRRGGNGQTPAEEHLPEQNVEQENESAYSRITRDLSRSAAKITHDGITWVLNKSQPFLREHLKKVLGLLFVALLSVFLRKTFLLSYICSTEIRDFPYISELCNDQNSTQTVLPLKLFIEENVMLAERISNTDVAITGKLSDARMSLFELTTLVSFSQLETSTKNQLMQKIDEIADRVQTTSRGMHKMLAKFHTTLEELESYAKRLYKHLTNQKSIFARWIAKGDELEIVRQYFDNDLEPLESEIVRVANDTEKVNSMLDELFENFRQLNLLAGQSYNVNFKELAQIDNASFIIKLYQNILGNGDIHKVKHQQNLQVLHQFTNITRESADQTLRVLEGLGRFQTEVERMKKVASRMDRAKGLHVDIHREALLDAIEKLRTYRLRFVQRRDEVNQI